MMKKDKFRDQKVAKQIITIEVLGRQFERINEDTNLLHKKSLAVLAVWVTILSLSFDKLLKVNVHSQNSRVIVLLIITSIIFIFSIYLLIRHSILASRFSDPPGSVTVKKEIRDKHTESEYNEFLINDYIQAYSHNAERVSSANSVFNKAVIAGTVSLLLIIFLVS